MKKNLLICNTFLIFYICFTYSQDTNIVKYFPLNVGNVWVYRGVASSQYCNLITKRRIKIKNTITINTKKYFFFADTTCFVSGGGGNCVNGGSINFDSLRIDSINGNIYKYSNPGCNYLSYEITLDSMKSRLNNMIKVNCGTDTNYKCTDTSYQVIFGVNRQTRSFSELLFETFWRRTFVKGIGEGSYSYQQLSSTFNATLIGCVIDGVLYGDTSFFPTSINNISSAVPDSFSLFQNYPNPFNPTTKIKFSIAASPVPSKGEGQEVSLKIFDILGKEVATLVNENLSPGTYEVEFNGSNYASGIYYYKLTATEFTETKKLILLK